MYSSSIIAVTGALLSVVAAVPMADNHHHLHHHAKREIVWVTQVEEEVVTVAVTKTVWVEPGETIPAEAPAAPAASSTEAAAHAQVYQPPPQQQAAPASSSAAAAPAPAAPASQEQEQAPAPSSSQYVAPSPTSTYVAPAPATTQQAPASSAAPVQSSSYAAPAPASSSSSSGSSGSSSGSGVSGMAAPGTSYTGDLTNYDISAGLGSCGESMTQSDDVVAVSHVIMSAYNGGNPNNNPLCNTYVNIKGVDGNMYKGKIMDTCPGCLQNSLDLSLDFFNKVTNNGDGRVHNIEWSFES